MKRWSESKFMNPENTKFEEIIPLLLLVIVITAEAAALTKVTLYDVF